MPPLLDDAAVRLLSLDAIHAESPSVRVSLDQEKALEYARRMQEGDNFPPVVVFHDVAVDAYWLADGAHRVEATKKIERKEIAAKVLLGNRSAAVLHAVEANLTHGLPMSLEDRKQAARLLLADPEWSTWSSREIGRRCKLDGKTIEELRKEVSAEIPQMRKCTRNDQEYSITTGCTEPVFPDEYHRAFSVIVAAPPWSKRGKKRIRNLPVDQLAKPGAVLFLWVDNEFLEDAFSVLRKWGFAYQDVLTWVRNVRGKKARYGGDSTQCLVATLRFFKRDITFGVTSLLEEGCEDLQKLTSFWEIVESCPGRKIGLYLEPRDGWESWQVTEN